MKNRGWVRTIDPKKLSNLGEEGKKHYRFYKITKEGKKALEEFPALTPNEITERIENWKRITSGRFLQIGKLDSSSMVAAENLTEKNEKKEKVDNETMMAIENLAKNLKEIFFTDWPTGKEEISTLFWKLRSRGKEESNVQTREFFEILLKELQDIQQEKDADEHIEFGEEIVLILKDFIQHQEETFQEYLQLLNRQPMDLHSVYLKMGDALRHMLMSLRSAQATLPFARDDLYFTVLSKELNQIGQEKEENGHPEFSEEIILILKQFLEEQGENFQIYLRGPQQSSFPEIQEMLRRMLVSLRSAQVNPPTEKEPKRSFFRRSREDETPGFQEKSLGDIFANIYEDIRLIVKPSTRAEDFDLVQKIFFGMVEAMNYSSKVLNPPDKSVLLGKYMPLLGSLIGASVEKPE